MQYPGNIIGPLFENGDLVSFTFDGAELTLRLPVVPNNRHNEDTVSRIKDLRGIDTRDWDTNDQDRPCIQLATQRWSFEDVSSLDDIAQCEVQLSLIEVTQLQREKNILLNTESFEEVVLAWMTYSFKDHEEKYLEDATWPAIANRYLGKSIAKEYLDWFMVQLCFFEGTMPRPTVMIPINNRFVMMASIEIDSLHYAGRQNPYSKKLLREFEFDLFDDFLSHFDLRYTPETIAIIQNKKSNVV